MDAITFVGFAVFASVALLIAYFDSGGSRRDQGPVIRVNWREAIADEAFRASDDIGLLRRILKRLEGVVKALAPVQAVEDIRKRLVYAGRSRSITPEEFYSLKLACAVVVFGFSETLMLMILGARGVALGLAFGAVGYLIPDLWLNNEVAKRKRRIEKELPAFLDVLALVVDAGLSLSEGISRVADYYGGILAGEFRRTLNEIKMGRPVAEAFEDLGERNGVEDLKVLTTALVQAERHGTPVSKVLREQGQALRQSRRTKAQEMVQKSAVKILVPVVVFMFLPMMVLLLGPAVVNLVRA
ncbi:MAG: type II secretion system F family protein, partial [Anaerolineae bacterium]